MSLLKMGLGKETLNMSRPMMTLGPLIFHLNSATYQKLQRRTEYQWAAQDRLRQGSNPFTGGPALQYISPGNDTIGLDGVIYPEQLGSQNAMDLMRAAAGAGRPLPLIQYMKMRGLLLGLWVIEGIDETQDTFGPGGLPRKIEFHLSLKRYRLMKSKLGFMNFF